MFYLKNYHHGPGRTRTTSHKQHLELGCAGATRSDGVILDKELVSWLKKSDKRRIYEGLKQFLVLEWECYPCAYLKFETMTPCCNILQWYCNSANDCAQWWPWLSIPNYPNVMQTISLVDSWYVYIYIYIYMVGVVETWNLNKSPSFGSPALKGNRKFGPLGWRHLGWNKISSVSQVLMYYWWRLKYQGVKNHKYLSNHVRSNRIEWWNPQSSIFSS